MKKIELTGFHLIFERVSAVCQELVDILRFVGQGQVEQLQQLLRVVEVENLRRTVERRPHVVEQHLDELAKEFIRVALAVLRVRKQI